jgi:hypothetical protein
MGLEERGRTGVKVNLWGDGIFGVVTQNPESMLHSIAGLTDADGNTAFGSPFSMLFYFTHTTTAAEQTTNSAPASTNAPWKFRVLGVKVRCISSQGKEFTPEYGHLRVSLQDNDGSSNFTSIIPPIDIGDMETGDVREFPVIYQDTAVIGADEGLRCRFQSKADSGGVLPIVQFLVEVQCLRVV